jgi:hypothetical protein
LPSAQHSLGGRNKHYQFAVRADVVAWDVEARALLHIENRTRFPDFQEMAGSFTAKRAYLGASVAERLGLPSWARETHVIAALWTSEVLHGCARTRSSLCIDEPLAFHSWWSGTPLPRGVTSSLVVLDPLATQRQGRWIDLEHAIGAARPRHRGYAEVAAKGAAAG